MNDDKNKPSIITFIWPIAVFILVLVIRYILLSQHSPGENLYQQHCSNCHMADGNGLKKLIPPLVNSNYLTAHERLIPCIIRYGQQGEILVNGVTYDHPMPANEILTENEITTLINYIRSSWGNKLPAVSLKEVKEQLESCSNTDD